MRNPLGERERLNKRAKELFDNGSLQEAIDTYQSSVDHAISQFANKRETLDQLFVTTVGELTLCQQINYYDDAIGQRAARRQADDQPPGFSEEDIRAKKAYGSLKLSQLI